MQSFIIEDKDVKNPNKKFLIDAFVDQLDQAFLKYLKNCETKGLDQFYDLCILKKMSPSKFCEQHKKTIRWTHRAREQIKAQKPAFYEELNLVVLELKLMNVSFIKDSTKKIIKLLKYVSRFFFDVQVQIEKSSIRYFEIKNIAAIMQIAPNITLSGLPIRKLLEAELRSTEIALKVKKLKLSPLEKLVIAHDHTILSIDNISSIDYAEIMQDICSKMGIASEYVCTQKVNEGLLSCLAYQITDLKYGIKKGSYFVGDINDDAKCSKKSISYLHLLDTPKDVILCPMLDCFTIEDKYLTAHNKKHPSSPLQIPLDTPPLSIKTIHSAINNAYAEFQFQNHHTSPSIINDAINHSVKLASTQLKSGSQNPFYTEWEQKKETTSRLKKRVSLKSSRI